MGWASRQNGEVLALSEGQFDVFLTVDRNLSFQQDATRFDIAVVVMSATGNWYADPQPMVKDVLAVLATASARHVVTVRRAPPSPDGVARQPK